MGSESDNDNGSLHLVHLGELDSVTRHSIGHYAGDIFGQLDTRYVILEEATSFGKMSLLNQIVGKPLGHFLD